MSGKRYTFDTNLLFYSLDADAGLKYKTAQKLIGSADYYRAVILLQTLGELMNAVHRKNQSTSPDAERFLHRAIAMFEIVPASSQDLVDALAARSEHNLSFWDAMIWATARRAGCNIIFTEDFQDGRKLEGVTFRNPFKLSSAELDKLLS